jgi:glutathione synthase
MGSDYAPSPDTFVGVPSNPALSKLPSAMHVAHDHYQSRFEPSHPAVILFVVQEGETNTVDQRMLEFQLWSNHNVPVVRMSLTKANTRLKLDEESGALYILPDTSADGAEGSIPIKYEVSVVYFRAGYAPTDYPDGYDGIEWESREMIERSRATKCPQLGYHLAGTKKVQQELARPGVLERFFDEKEIGTKENGLIDLDRMRGAFAGLYSLGEDAVEEDLVAVKEAISGKAGMYVLKPQREGGGYNFYSEELAEKLKENITIADDGSLKLGEDLAEFILMQRLFPPKQTAVLLRAGLVEGTGESISELGCFGTIVRGHDGVVLHNEYAGFLLRTKFSDVDEGGVASGFATLSSPYLC